MSVSRKDIIDTIKEHYLLTAAEIALLSSAIYDALKSSMTSAYRWAAYLLGFALEWTPDASQEKALEALAHERSTGIASTYKDDIIKATEAFLAAYELATGSLEGVLTPLRETLKDYTDARTEVKQEQVAQYEVGEGANTGTETLIDDVLNSDEYDDSGDISDTVYVSPEDMALIFVGVLPYSGQCYLCAEWGGEMVELLEADTIPPMPNHNGCDHYKTLVDLREAA